MNPKNQSAHPDPFPEGEGMAVAGHGEFAVIGFISKTSGSNGRGTETRNQSVPAAPDGAAALPQFQAESFNATTPRRGGAIKVESLKPEDTERAEEDALSGVGNGKDERKGSYGLVFDPH